MAIWEYRRHRRQKRFHVSCSKVADKKNLLCFCCSSMELAAFQACSGTGDREAAVNYFLDIFGSIQGNNVIKRNVPAITLSVCKLLVCSSFTSHDPHGSCARTADTKILKRRAFPDAGSRFQGFRGPLAWPSGFRRNAQNRAQKYAACIARKIY